MLMQLPSLRECPTQLGVDDAQCFFPLFLLREIHTNMLVSCCPLLAV